MGERPISIQDIARAAGVSHTTVSRALHDSPVISRAVRDKVHDLALQMGYTPNAVAQSLKRQQTRAIGLVVTSISDPFVGLVVRGIEETAQQERMSVFLSVSYNDPEREMAAIETFHRRRVDGIISAAAQISGRYTERLARTRIPTVLINQQAEPATDLLHSVEVDDYSGARLAVSHLIGLGHRRIGYIGAGNRPRSNRRRLAGYRDALESARLQAEDCWVRIAASTHRFHTEDVADGHALLRELLQADITAVFCYNDMIAIGALLACGESSIRVPERLSVIGFDDIDMSQYVTPRLSSIRQPSLQLGRLAMRTLLDLLNDRPVQNHVLPTELVVRASTAGPPGDHPVTFEARERESVHETVQLQQPAGSPAKVG
jgi:LacI family transcriptional regulator/LacI family repressor for deo operon, udp, cdd, tsx, nupC, and nupG